MLWQWRPGRLLFRWEFMKTTEKVITVLCVCVCGRTLGGVHSLAGSPDSDRTCTTQATKRKDNKSKGITTHLWFGWVWPCFEKFKRKIKTQKLACSFPSSRRNTLQPYMETPFFITPHFLFFHALTSQHYFISGLKIYLVCCIIC